MDGVKLRITRDGVRAIAEKAVELKTGARALRSIMEGITLDVMMYRHAKMLLKWRST